MLVGPRLMTSSHVNVMLRVCCSKVDFRTKAKHTGHALLLECQALFVTLSALLARHIQHQQTAGKPWSGIAQEQLAIASSSWWTEAQRTQHSAGLQNCSSK